MSEGIEGPGPLARGADARIGTGRAAVVVAAAAFWGYLVIRWLVNWGLGPLIGVKPGEPFLPAGLFAQWHASLSGVSGPLAVIAGPLAGFASFLKITATSLPTLAAGVWLTVVLTVVSILLGLVIAVPLAVARAYGGRAVSGVAFAYTELIRGTPLLAQLFVLYFGLRLTVFFRELPGVGGILPGQAVLVAVVGFTINSSAYQSEYIRSALGSVAGGQIEAARSIGLSRLAAIRYVILPQGLRYAIPGWSNELVYLIKYSSLATFITVSELFYQTRIVANETFRYFDLYLLAALFYLGLVLSASALMGRFERTVSIPGLGTSRRRT